MGGNTVKKTLKTTVLAVVAIFAVVLFSTCELFSVGLGSKVDITAPQIRITSHVSAGYVSGNIVLAGTAFDDVAVTLVEVFHAGHLLTTATIDGEAWSATVASTSLADGESQFIVRASDSSGKKAETSVVLYVDNHAPTVLVKTPVASTAVDAVYNTRIQFRVYTYDRSPVDRVELVLYDQAGSVIVRKDALNIDGWMISIERDIDVPGFEWSTLDGQNLHYEFLAHDRAGNTSSWFYHAAKLPAGYSSVEDLGPADQSSTVAPAVLAARFDGATREGVIWQAEVLIDFDSDKPFFSISVPSDGAVLGSGSAAIGTVQDDDAVVPASIRARVRPTSGGSTYELGAIVTGNSAAGAQAYNFQVPLTTTGIPVSSGGLPFPDGEYEIIFIADDISLPPVVGQSDPLVFVIDKAVPSIQGIFPEPGGYIAVDTDVELSAIVTDDNGLSSVRMSIDGGASWATASLSGPPADANRWAAEVNVPSSTATPVNVIFEATDTTGKTARFTAQYQIDDQAPTIEILAPDLGLPVNGRIRLRTFVVDNNSIASVRLKIGPGMWQDYASRDVVIDTTGFTDGSIVPFWIEAMDSAGYLSSYEGAFTIDQSSDLPVSGFRNLDDTATDPSRAGDNLFAAGPVISGNAEDDDGIASNGVSYLLDGGTWTPASVQGAARFRTFSVDLSALSEGIRSITIRTTDDESVKEGSDAASVDIGPVWFAVDNANPVITVDGSWGVGIYKTAAGFDITGSASDANGITALSASGAGSLVATGSAGDTSRTWSVPVAAPVQGINTVTITATDGVGKTSTQEVKFFFDSEAPDLTVDNLADGSAISSASYTINGRVADLSGIAAIEFSLYDGTAWDGWATVSTVSQSWSHLVTGLTEGAGQQIRFRARDNAGNVATTAAIGFALDLNPPTLTSNKASFDNTFQSSPFVLSGTTSDANGIKKLEISYDAGSNYSVITTTPASTTDPTVISWSQTVAVAANGADDGLKAIRIKATDQYDKETIVPLAVRFDSSAPTFGFNNLVDNQLLTALSFSATGTWTDNGGSGTIGGDAKIQWALTDSADDGDWTSFTATASAWNGTIVFPGQTLAQNLFVRALDAIGNTSASVMLTLKVDTELPVVAETAINTSDLALRNNGVTLSGTASDTLGLASVIITATKDGADQGPIYTNNNSGTGWGPSVVANYSHTVTAPGNDGLWIFTITATDVVGRSTSLNRTVQLDSTPGTSSIIAPVSSELVGGTTYTFTGTANDGTGSGVKTVRVAFASDGTNAVTAAGTVSWSANITLASTLGLEGPKTVYVQVEDNAGNTSTWTAAQQAFVYDTAPPVLVQDGPLSRDTGTGFTLTGTATDVYGLAAASVWTVTQQKDGGSVVPVATNPIALGGTVQSRTWSLANLPRDPGNIGIQQVMDGTYVYVITASDLAGRISNTIAITVRIDTTPPETLAITAPVSGQTGINALAGGAFTFRGTASDAGVGIAKIHYVINQNPAAAAGTAGYTELATTGIWSFTDDFDTDGPGGDAGRAEGTWYIHVKAEDKAGNITADGNALTLVFDIDQANPGLTETTIGTAVLQNRNVLFSLGGSATDTHGVANVNVSQSKDGSAPVLISANGPSLGAGVQSRTWDLTNLPRNPGSIGSAVALDGNADGIYEYDITVTDLVGKTTSIKRTLRLDTQSPVLVVTAPVAGEGVAGPSYTIRGTVTDNSGIGVSSLTYSVDSTNGTDGTWIPVTPVFSWSVPTIDFSAGGQGLKSLWVRAGDGLNPLSTRNVSFYYDTENPVLTETVVASDLIQYRNTAFNFAGNASDSNELDRLELRINDGAPTTITVTPGTGAWTYEHPATPLGDFNLVFTAIDVAGRTTSLNRRVYMDNVAPTVGVTTDLTGWRSNPNISVSGTAADANSGVEAVEYSLDSGSSWALLTGTASWSGTIAFSAGVNTLQVRSRDRAGNVSSVVAGTVQIDTASPMGEVTSPIDLPKLNGQADLPVSLTGADTSNGSLNGSGVASILVKVNNTDFSTDTIAATLSSGDVDSGVWTASIPAASINALTNGQRTIHLRVTDGAGLHSFMSFPILVDKTPPSLAISSPEANAVVNKAITVSGTASDTQGLDPDAPIDAHIWNQSTSQWIAITPINGSFNWSFSLNTATYDSATYDVNGAAGTQIRIRVTARDEAGNTTQLTRELTIDQNSDRPVVTLNNIDVASLSTLKLSRTIYGQVSDDDGSVASLQVSLDGTNWTARLVSGGAWTYDIPGGIGDGLLTLFFRITDSVGAIFTSTEASTLNRPRVFIDATPTYSDTAVAFRLDTVTPEIDSVISTDRTVPLTFDDPVALVTNMAFGGTAAEFRVRVLAWDANGISSVTVTVPGAAGSPFTASLNGAEGGFDRYDTGTIDVGGLTDGSKDVLITVTDSSGLVSTATRTILVDNSAPDYTYLSPVTSAIVNGNVEIKGLSSDSGSGLASVEYKLGYNHGTQSWAPVSGSLFNWQINLTGTNRIDNYAGLGTSSVNTETDTITIDAHGFTEGMMAWVGATDLPGGLNAATTYYVRNPGTNTFQLSATPGGVPVNLSSAGTGVRVSVYSKDLNNDGVWLLPVLLRIRDNAGNTRTTAETDIVIQVDPTGDIPKVAIVYPDPTETNRTLGGSIRLFGTAEDDDGVEGVYMQITEDPGAVFGAYTASNGIDWWNGGFGQKVSGTVSWNQTINAAGEFDPPGAGTRTIWFRVRARDIFGLDGPWSAPQRIDVDKNAPKIGSSQPLTLVQGVSQQTYVADTWLKGAWVLTGSVEDESGIQSVTISGDINGSLAANPAWFTPAVGGNYTFAIPVTTAGSAGSISFTITALDASTPQLQTSILVRVNADNTAPVGASYSGSLPIVQSNLAYTLSSSFTETGSGFGRVAFYLVRRDRGGNTANDRIYMPMGNNIHRPLTGLTLINGLYYLEGTATSRPDAYSLTHADLIGNQHVRVGGLVRIAGLDRRIVTWNSGTGTITWADEVDTGITSYAVGLAMVVDNQTAVETPVYSGSTLISIVNDDGDGMVESVERIGGLYNWTASINSKNIPDGPIEIHWVSFDRAGNFTTQTVSTSIANNRPLLAKVTLGTDLDGNGTVSAGEQVSPYSTLDGFGKEQAVATAGSAAFVAKGLTTAEIDVVGGNGALQYRLMHGATDLHGGLQLLRPDDVSPVNPVTLTETQLLGVGDGSRTFIITIWDSTEETVPGTDSLSAELTVPMTLRLIDIVPPKAVILPFYWNSATDNSLYLNSRHNGHIELPDGLPAAPFNQASGLLDLDPKVSGQISIRGTAYDDQRVTSLWLAIDGFAFPGAPANSNQFDTNADGVLETLGRTYYQVATFTAGTWTGTDQWDTNGWKVTVDTTSLDQNGHQVAWQLDWDTSRVTGVAALDRTIRVIAVDKRGVRTNASSEADNITAEVSTNNRPSQRVDVVPFIRAIENPANEGLSSDVLRSSSGRYSMDQHPSNLFTVHGFNLGAAVTYTPSSRITSAVTTAPAGLNPATTFVSSSQIRVSKNLTRSGYLTVFVNGVPSINNLASQDQSWHSEKDQSKIYSEQWTTMRYLWVWATTSVLPAVNNQTFYYPDMYMDGDQPIFSYADDNTGRTRRTTGDTTWASRSGLWFSRQTQIGYAGGSYWLLALEDSFSSGAAAGYLYLNRDTNNNAANGDPVNNLIEILNIDYTSRQLNRVRYPKMIMATNGANADAWIAYYDAHPGHQRINFVSMTATGINTTLAGYTQPAANGQRATPVMELPFAEAGAGHSQFYELVKYGANGYAVVYYDEAMSLLRMMYSTNAVTGNNVANTGATWNHVTLDSSLFSGSHVSAVADASNIYVTYYDSGNANLKALVVPHASMIPSAPVVVDAYLSVGTWTKIELMDFDGAGTSYETVPVISYYSDSFSGTRKPIKMAFPTTAANFMTHGVLGSGSSEAPNDTWEIMTVPANTPPRGGMEQFSRTMLKQYTNNGMTLPTVAWLAARIEYAKLQPNN